VRSGGKGRKEKRLFPFSYSAHARRIEKRSTKKGEEHCSLRFAASGRRKKGKKGEGIHSISLKSEKKRGKKKKKGIAPKVTV